jgi:hypothetical protein
MKKSKLILPFFLLLLISFFTNLNAQQDPPAIGYDTIVTIDPETYNETISIISKSAAECYAFSWGEDNQYAYQEFPYDFTREQLEQNKMSTLKFVKLGSCIDIKNEKYSLIVLNQGNDPIGIERGPNAVNDMLPRVKKGSLIIIHDIEINGHAMDDIRFLIK